MFSTDLPTDQWISWPCITRTVFGAFAGKLENKAVFNLKKVWVTALRCVRWRHPVSREMVLLLTS